MARITGGGNRLQLHKILINSSTTVTFAATSTVFDEIISTTIGRTETGSYTISLDQVKADSGVLTTFLEEAITIGATGGETIIFEDGTEISGSSSTVQYLAIVSGGIEGTNRLTWVGVVTVDPTSGGLTQTANTFVRPSISLTSVAVGVDATVGTANFPTTLYTPAAAVTVDYDTQRYGAYKFIPKQT